MDALGARAMRFNPTTSTSAWIAAPAVRRDHLADQRREIIDGLTAVPRSASRMAGPGGLAGPGRAAAAGPRRRRWRARAPPWAFSRLAQGGTRSASLGSNSAGVGSIAFGRARPAASAPRFPRRFGRSSTIVRSLRSTPCRPQLRRDQHGAWHDRAFYTNRSSSQQPRFNSLKPTVIARYPNQEVAARQAAQRRGPDGWPRGGSVGGHETGTWCCSASPATSERTRRSRRCSTLFLAADAAGNPRRLGLSVPSLFRRGRPSSPGYGGQSAGWSRSDKVGPTTVSTIHRT
jgi:hypothetical protein